MTPRRKAGSACVACGGTSADVDKKNGEAERLFRAVIGLESQQDWACGGVLSRTWACCSEFR